MQLKSYAGELMSWPAGNVRPTRSSMPWTSSPVTLLSARSGLLGAVVRLFAKARVAYRTAPCKAAAFVLGRIAHFLWAGGKQQQQAATPALAALGAVRILTLLARRGMCASCCCTPPAQPAARGPGEVARELAALLHLVAHAAPGPLASG